ncbi:MAG: CRTAC1 family protein, partial [Polyangiaceae bacterium]
GWTLATSTFDYDGDGDQDLFLANDFGADVFYQNNGDGTFKDVSGITETADRGSGMNVSVTDVNGDGFPDFYVANIDMFSKNIKIVFPNDLSTINNYDSNLQKSFQYLSGNKLFLNPGDPQGKKPFLADQGTRFEPGDRGWSWAAVFFDYENDGDEDMYLSTGWVEGSFAANQKKQMFLAEDGAYYLAPPASAEAFASNGRSAVAVDIDRDGDLDLVLTNYLQPPAIFENTQAMPNHAVQLRLRGKAPNTGAVGARVMLSANGKKQRREVSCGNGYLGQNDEVIYVGIGAAATAEAVVRWPSGKEQTVSDLKPGAVVEIVEGAAR